GRWRAAGSSIHSTSRPAGSRSPWPSSPSRGCCRRPWRWASRRWPTAWWTTSCASPMPEARIGVDVVVAWPRRHLARRMVLPAGATVREAIAAAGFDAETLACVTGVAVHGELVDRDRLLRDGDRVELLRPLQADPKDARRLRAERQRGRR